MAAADPKSAVQPGGSGVAKWLVAALVVILLVGVGVWLGTQSQVAAVRKQDMQYLADNGKKPGVITTASGLQYRIITQGNGAKPGRTDTVLVHYEGRLLDGTVFDSSYQRGQPAQFPLDAVIPGWTEGVQLMNTGSKYRFTVPPALGYGARGAGGVIPPGAVLEFDIELLGVRPKQ